MHWTRRVGQLPGSWLRRVRRKAGDTTESPVAGAGGHGAAAGKGRDCELLQGGELLLVKHFPCLRSPKPMTQVSTTHCSWCDAVDLNCGRWGAYETRGALLSLPNLQNWSARLDMDRLKLCSFASNTELELEIRIQHSSSVQVVSVVNTLLQASALACACTCS